MPWQERDVACGGVQIHLRRFLDSEESHGHPVLLLHGLGVGGAVWQAFARRLAPRFLALAPDLRGHGMSDAPPSGYAPTDYARDLAILLETVSPRERVPVLGHSLGALVAIALADLRADLVSALILVDPPLDAERRNEDVARVYRLRHATPGDLEAYLERTNPGGGRLLAEALARLYRQAADAAFEAMLAAPPGHPRAWQQAARVQQPVLLVQADPAVGGLMRDSVARDLVARLARSRLHQIKGASHAVHASHPVELAEVARAFLNAALDERTAP